MAKIFLFMVYNDNMLLTNNFTVSENEVNRLVKLIQETYFTPSGPFEIPFEEVSVNKVDGQTGYFNLTPWTIVKYYEKGSDYTEINFVIPKVNLESDK